METKNECGCRNVRHHFLSRKIPEIGKNFEQLIQDSKTNIISSVIKPSVFTFLHCFVIICSQSYLKFVPWLKEVVRSNVLFGFVPKVYKHIQSSRPLALAFYRWHLIVSYSFFIFHTSVEWNFKKLYYKSPWI